jgi:methionine sulfoxide reductase heme-binding subunit
VATFPHHRLYRNLSLIAVVFLAVHVVTASVDPFTHLGWVAAVIPFGSYYRTFWLGLGTVAADLMAAIVFTSLVRGLLGQRAWRLVHRLAYASWPIAIIHGLGTGTDSGSAWMLAIDVVCVAGVVAAMGGRLLMRPAYPLAADRARFRSGVRREIRG